jgi:hypothetical protein
MEGSSQPVSFIVGQVFTPQLEPASHCEQQEIPMLGFFENMDRFPLRALFQAHRVCQKHGSISVEFKAIQGSLPHLNTMLFGITRQELILGPLVQLLTSDSFI